MVIPRVLWIVPQLRQHRICLCCEREHLRLLGEIASHRDPPEIEPADTHYQEALTLANELGMRPLQAHCQRGLGTLYSQTGPSEHARAALSSGISMYREMEMTVWLRETEAKLAEVEGLVTSVVTS